jgi:LacI family transcriptional regulator
METRSAPHRVKRQVLLLLGVYYPAHHSGIARYAREAGWVLNNTYAQGGRPPIWWRGDGMITLITSPKDYAALRRFPALPLVDLSRGWVTNAMPARLRRTGAGRPRVLYDNARIGRLAAEHFLERGFKHVAFFNFGNFWMETDRIPAFRATVEAAGGWYHEIKYHQHFSLLEPNPTRDERAAYRWLVATLRRLPKPVGIFAANDDMAVKILCACDDAAVDVPEEAAVLGCDNDPLICDYTPVPLSSIDNDLEGQGYEAARLLDRLMDGQPAAAAPILIPPRGVVVRQSTNILAVPHAKVARALRHIWEHYREPIQTGDVAAAAGLSRRGLEQAFQKHLGRTIAAEIRHCRIEHSRKLLLETHLKAHQIAAQSGFSGIVHFSQAFTRAVGIRPSHFRRRGASSALAS